MSTLPTSLVMVVGQVDCFNTLKYKNKLSSLHQLITYNSGLTNYQKKQSESAGDTMR